MSNIKLFDETNQEITILAELGMNNNNLSEVKEFCKSYSKVVLENEPDAIQFNFFYSELDREITLVEKFKDSNAFINHTVNISVGGILEHQFQELVKIFSVKSIKILGTCSEELIKSNEKLDLTFNYRQCAGGCVRF